MITGFNTDIDHRDKVFHVQTEDKGLDNPVVETLVYCKGEILTASRSSYEDLVRTGEFSEEDILQRMEEQHQRVIGEIQAGPHMPFGYELITNRSFDQVVADWLRQNALPEQLILKMLDWQVLREGTRPTVRLSVQGQSTQSPVVDAMVTVRLVTGEDSSELFSASTDQDGFVEACFEIPDVAGPGAEIVFEALKSGATAECKQPVKD